MLIQDKEEYRKRAFDLINSYDIDILKKYDGKIFKKLHTIVVLPRLFFRLRTDEEKVEIDSSVF